MKGFKEGYAQLNTAQKKAVDTIDGPLLVIAGPGTGKTQLLSMRVANILLKTDADAHNILCLTFTESAAFEMRQRLVNIIGQAAYNITISTYHAFGKELIGRFPEYFEEVSGARPVDELAVYTIIQSLIENLDYANPLKKSDYYIKDVISTISDLKRALLDPDDLRQVAKTNQDFIRSTNIQTKKELANIVRISKKTVPQFSNLLNSLSQPPTKSASYKGVITLRQLFIEELESALDEVGETGKTTPLSAWKNKWLARDEAGDFVVQGQIIADKLRALADIYERYIDALAKDNLFDYDDMILRAIDSLRRHTDLRYTLQEQYMYMLLDEFQDTNEAQLELVKLLTDNPAYENRPNILAVGDDDQAIYAFQGARHSHMLTFKDMYRDVQVITLTQNYRSHKDILHVAHGIAEQIEERLHHHLADVTKLLTAESSHLPEKAQVARHEFKSDLAQYAWVTKQIANLIKAGTNPSEIAVLAPQHRYLEPIVPYLQQAKIPVRYDKRENVLEDRHIVQLARMSQLVLALHNQDYNLADHLWPEILSYDFWQLSTETIWELSWQAYDTHTDWSRLLLRDPQTKPIGLFFAQLQNMVEVETLEKVLDYLIGVETLSLGKDTAKYASPFYQYHFSADSRQKNAQNFWNLLSNLTVLRQNLREYRSDPESQLSLQSFVTFIDEHMRADIKVLNTSPYHEAAEAVQVMTAYKAKGMEFEHVFVVACVDEVWGSKSSSQHNKLPLPPNLNFVRYQGASDDERLRLFFVAITRAKLGLYLTSYQANFANRITTRLKYLNEVEQEGSVLSQLLPIEAQKIKHSDYSAPSIEELSVFWQSRHTDPSGMQSLKALLKPRLDRYQLAPTHLNGFTDLEYGGPEHFFLNTILRFPKAPTIDGEFGNAIHETLEWIHIANKTTGHLPTKAAIQKQFVDKLTNKNISRHDQQLLLKRGKHCLDAFVAQRSGSFDPANEHEYSFKNQGVFVGHAHMSGKIDKLIIDKKKHQITVVDYKTGASHSKWDSSVKLHKYKQQLYMYKLLVEGSYQFADYSVTEAYLEFVEPDSNGKVQQLAVNFEPSEVARIKKLIIATWEHITTLNFPDVSNYSHDLKGVKQFEDDLIEGRI